MAEPITWEYILKRWPIAIAAIGGIAWITRLQAVATANAEDTAEMKKTQTTQTAQLAELPYIKEKVDGLIVTQDKMAEEQKLQGKILARIEAKL